METQLGTVLVAAGRRPGRVHALVTDVHQWLAARLRHHLAHVAGDAHGQDVALVLGQPGDGKPPQ